jgi:hypothetical protein
MEGKRFDQLARALATSSSRRRVLAGLLAGALGSLRIQATSAQDDGVVIADASGGNDNLATVVDPASAGSNRDSDQNNREKDKDQDGERHGCDEGACPADESTSSTGPGFCCDDGFCSCGGQCCGGPDCWFFHPDLENLEEPIVIETCTRREGCLQCPRSGSQCCVDCTRSGDCVSPCIECPGEPSRNHCCAKCIDESTQCNQAPDPFPISGGIIRRR